MPMKIIEVVPTEIPGSWDIEIVELRKNELSRPPTKAAEMEIRNIGNLYLYFILLKSNLVPYIFSRSVIWKT